MKTIIIYYSRTGTTKKVAEKLKEKLNADLEEINDLTDRKGALGYLKSGREAMKEKPAQIEPIKSDLSLYDLVIVGTPIWAFNMSSPVRAFLLDSKDKLKKVAFFATQGGNGSDKAFIKMSKIINQESPVTMSLLTKEVVTSEIEDKINSFVSALSQSNT